MKGEVKSSIKDFFVIIYADFKENLNCKILVEFAAPINRHTGISRVFSSDD